ncbi:MAG: glycosyltransferase [Bryobacteraceae bacterium]
MRLDRSVRRITDDLPMCEALRSGDVQISVVIPTYCRCYLLKRTTEALQAQVGPMRYEVIWADDGSSDETENILRSAAADRPDFVPVPPAGTFRSAVAPEK